MGMNYFQLSYPNFVLGAIIDPEEANQNNFEIVGKINELVDGINVNTSNIDVLSSVKADKTYVDGKVLDLSGVNRTTETIYTNSKNLITHKASNDHDSKYYTKILLDGGQLDSRYYTETEINYKLTVINNTASSNLSTLNNSINVISQNLATHKTSNDHDSRYYTKTELEPWFRGGDTTIREETFTIVNPDTGIGTFIYSYKGIEYTGNLSQTGGQIFELKTGYYIVGLNRLDVMIDDILRRSVSSGGIIEMSETLFELTTPEDVGTEINAKYFERIGFVAEYNIKLGVNKPPSSGGKNMWFKIIG